MGKYDRAFISHSTTRSNIIIYASQNTTLTHTLAKLPHTKPSNDDELLSEQPSDLSSCNKKLAWYVKNGDLKRAQNLFDEIPNRDVVSWNTMLTGLRNANDPTRVFEFFTRMRRHGVSPSGHTISLVLSSVLASELSVLLVSQLHAIAIQLATHFDAFVGSALMRGYGNLGDPIALKRVFDEIHAKSVVSWNVLVSGYMRLGFMYKAQQVFDSMLEKDLHSWTSLINGYIANKRINKARHFFDMIREKNVISWSVMIDGYVQNRSFTKALELFVTMLNSCVRPNHFTISSALAACAGACSLPFGQQVHSAILKLGIREDIVMSSSLLDMYAKCGDIGAAFRAFETLPKKNVVSWNMIIGACSRHGLGARALEEFERMTSSGVGPDRVTFINVLSACAHGGLIEEGTKHFKSMESKYRIQAEIEHYASMVDLYGRAGELQTAMELIKGMPMAPDVVVWGALLAASALHSDIEVGKFAAEGINRVSGKDHQASYAMLSKIYGERGCWNGVFGLKNMMNRKRVKKQNAGSWVELSTDG